MTTQSRPESVGPELAALTTDLEVAMRGGYVPELPLDMIAFRLLAMGWRATNHQPVALDVERLARALHRNAVHNDKHPDYRGCSVCDPVAANIAAEYSHPARDGLDELTVLEAIAREAATLVAEEPYGDQAVAIDARMRLRARLTELSDLRAASPPAPLERPE